MRRLTFSLLAATLAGVTPALAHFQLAYTGQANLEAPARLPVKLIFWHPMENGHAMDIGQPEDVFYVFKGERHDLSESLTPITFTGAQNAAQAYEVTLPVKRNGDYILGVVPTPYYEGSEDIYIQQFTKSFLNKGGIPTGWNDPLGLPAEIVPLNKPTNVIAGSTFSGRVLSAGAPVAGAEIEIEYLAAEPDTQTNTVSAVAAGPMPGGAIVAIADENGVFTFGVPKAGHWGFAALGVGPDTEHEGKALSQDAVIWIKAYDLN
ncbi:cobalt/nickel transport protein [Rhodovulum imhoffii]|uniref:Cobalt/nickel transport protein n=1 Tax=Rhodovulum imhoffii TaxID=365340 RepID=A0A2T5BRG0_9RHOB|nr:DUF4198 domain-containing protein [Rhodovulum imhoffii]MBK5934477.1 nickel transporter [Rhodovulum imhoffii]PTN01827.1 cobalt/nickel transport protein [Rhodovulum imhoffii]